MEGEDLEKRGKAGLSGKDVVDEQNDAETPRCISRFDLKLV